ncbi:MAG: hypothetical protein LUD02_05040 [Tannerellaceae bacterium]|nr:hypothetical protein [Tannerellaceae bacterium]MCD8263590.1 hypothetical protein [Tannerellaceae bacterium]
MDRVERHLLTDEVFILLSGKALLIEATFGKEGIRFDTIPMEKEIIYNIPEGVWHNIALEKEAIVFIFENTGTHLRDCEYYSLTGEQQQLLDQLILHPAT